MTAISAAALYTGVNILFLFFLSFRVVGGRMRTKVSIGSGGDSDLELRMRAHGNAAEYIPACMLGLFVLAQFPVPVWAIHGLGSVFTLGRVLHAFGLSTTALWARQFGMIVTWLGMLGIGAAVIYVSVV
ncbi:MAPEG family protein [Hyphomonas sp.]|uniref:MAPEG family protein n=1 Tax=Hyphomonas sp. TaxID=87 RepID=UPI00334178FE